MPPNYRPPSPLPPSSPLPSSSPSSETDQFPIPFPALTYPSRTGHNISFSDAGEFRFADPFGNALDNTVDHTTLQSLLSSPPRLRHLSSTATNTTRNQHRTSPHNNIPTPTEIPALAHTPTPVELSDSVQPSMVPESLTMPGQALPVATKTSKRKSTKRNTENSEVVSAKRQKMGATVVSTDNSQLHVKEGRGKRQRFQSSRAATANAIGA